MAQARQGGYGGSQAATFGELRNLGLTSLQRADVAMNQSAQMLASMRSLMPQQQSVANMFLTPGQRIDFVRSERDARFQRDMQAAQAKAQADPVFKGVFDMAKEGIVKAASAGMGSFMGDGGGGFMSGMGTRAKGFLGIAPSSTVAGPAWMQSSFAPGAAPGFTPMAGMPGF